jgi:hypothetical protein
MTILMLGGKSCIAIPNTQSVLLVDCCSSYNDVFNLYGRYSIENNFSNSKVHIDTIEK